MIQGKIFGLFLLVAERRILAFIQLLHETWINGIIEPVYQKLETTEISEPKLGEKRAYLWIEHIIAFVTKKDRHFSLFLFFSRNSAPCLHFYFFGESTAPLSFRREMGHTRTQKVKKCVERKNCFLVETKRRQSSASFQWRRDILLVILKLENLKISRPLRCFWKVAKNL